MKLTATAAIRLAATLALAVASSATGQIRLNPAGEGQALHLPWYTVKDGQTTLVNVRNARPEAKAVRVTISEALNGSRARQINVYLGPHDSWTAALEYTAAGAQLRSLERSCVTPAAIDSGAPLGYLELRDNGPMDGNRLRTGSIDIVEMGVVGGGARAAVTSFDCASLRTSWSSGAWSIDPLADISSPTGGLSANATVLDLDQGSSYTMTGIAIEGFSRSARHSNANGAPLRFADAECEPSCSVRLPNGELVTRTFGRTAVTTLLMARELHEEIHVEPGLAAKTLWIVSFPTRSAYSDSEGDSLTAPFGGTIRSGKACQDVEWRAWSGDGELAYPIGPDLVFIGAGRCGLSLCDQTQAIEVTKSDDFPFIEPPPPCYFASASQELDVLPLHRLEGGRGMGQLFLGRSYVNDAVVPIDTVPGLPAVGVVVSTFTNANARPGVLATFNTTVPLRSR